MPYRPSADICVVRDLIDARARTEPDKTFAVFSDGVEWSYADLRDEVVRVAAGLAALGVGQDDHVLVWMPNCAAAVRVLFAINYLGAVCVPIGIGLRGAGLEHIIADSGAELVIADARLFERLVEVELSHVRRVVAIGRPDVDLEGLEVLDADVLTATDGEPGPPERPIAPWDTQCVLYTSGTTGPSKGVLSSYLHRHAHAVAIPQISADDRRLVHGPLSHTGGFGSVYGCLVLGNTVILANAFKTDTFWDTVNRFGATVTSLLGATLPFLLSRPSGPHDRDHTLRTALVAPVDENAMAFSNRFGVPVYGIYNMTEISVPLICGPVLDRRGQCGVPRRGVDVRLVDAADFDVEPGQSGELLVRTHMPWTISHGYLNNPQATVGAWRNGWFHTGDLFRQDPDGQFVYLDRKKDAVRRRGENISSFEVESEILRYRGVKDAAIVGVPSEYSEEEVLAVIAPEPGYAIAPEDLIAFLGGRLAHFMVPRFIRIMDALPYTSTHKVQKQVLRDAGITADTWDREKAGIKVRRDVLK